MKINDVVKFKQREDPDDPVLVFDIVGSRDCQQHGVEVDHGEFILRDEMSREIEGVCQLQLLLIQDNNNPEGLQSFTVNPSSYERSISMCINLDDGKTSIDLTINSSVVPYSRMKNVLDKLSWAIDPNELKPED